jgi:pimeloyl-ACP methyl ester carboxylesterase
LRRLAACDICQRKRTLARHYYKHGAYVATAQELKNGQLDSLISWLFRGAAGMKRQSASSLIVATLLLASCGGNGPDVGPANTSSGNGNPGGATPPASNTPGTALFQPLQGVLPYPTDIFFSGSTDGTLNIQPANALIPLQSSVNQLDGFSTTAVIRTRFASPINPATLNGSTVHVAQVVVSSTTKATVGFTKKLVVGTDPATADISVGVATDAGVGSTIVEIRPLKPLVPSAGPGATNVGYLVVLTNGITTTTGTAATPDADYADFKAKVAADPSCSVITNTSLNGLCRLTGAHLQIAAQAMQINPANVVLSFSFSTQATRDTMNVLADPAVTTARPIAAVNIGATTAALTPQGAQPLPGHADVYRGTLQVPYYSSRPSQANPTAPLTATWLGNPSQLDPSSRLLTRFNPVPVATATISIPLLVTVPNAASTAGATKPGGGWPVVIFQHGLTRSRLDVAGVADAFADAGFVVAAIDLPLHGVTASTNPLYDAANERTFNLDFVNNTTLATGPDGTIDSSGTHFVNVPNPLVTRDNLRQAAADLLTLTRSIGNLNLDADPAGDINTTRIHFVGHSLGGIVGGVYLGTAGAAEVVTGELANAGGGVAQTIFDSPAFGPRIKQGLAAQGITEGSTIYAQFIRDAQSVVDAGDPINYIASAAAARPLLMLQVVGGGTLPSGSASPPDQVVVNSATRRLIDAIGIPRISTVGVNPVTRGYVNFIFGEHGSLIDRFSVPSSATPLASPPTTAEMQAESVSFAQSLGASVEIFNGAVVQP